MWKSQRHKLVQAIRKSTHVCPIAHRILEHIKDFVVGGNNNVSRDIIPVCFQQQQLGMAGATAWSGKRSYVAITCYYHLDPHHKHAKQN